MKTFEIIELSPDEWPLYRQIRLEALHDAPQAFGTAYAEMVDRPEAFWRERLEKSVAKIDNWLYFARAEGRIVGITGAYLPEDAPPMVVSVFVHPDYRGLGISKALLATVLDALRARGLHVVELTVTRGQEAALGLYLRNGFQIVREEESRLGDGLVHTEYVMRRAL